MLPILRERRYLTGKAAAKAAASKDIKTGEIQKKKDAIQRKSGLRLFFAPLSIRRGFSAAGDRNKNRLDKVYPYGYNGDK